MRFAVLSDIHGNLAALDAVLADIATRGAHMIVNLGDILSGPLDPAGTADRLIALGLPTIAGNHERQLLTLGSARMNASDRFAAGVLSDRHLAWLSGLPATLNLADDLLLCHGSPSSDLDYLLEHVHESGARPATPAEVETRVQGIAASMILCGHTHIPRVHRRAGGGLIVNPGSVGLPAYDDDRPFPHVMESGSPHARYAIVDRDRDGAWSAELLAVDYDWAAAAETADARGRSDWAIALRTGRMR